MGDLCYPHLMRIALIHDFLTVFAGAERVLKVFHELYPEAPIYVAVTDEAIVQKHFPNATVHTSPLQNSWKRKINPLFLASLPEAIESFDVTSYDLVLSSSGAFAHGVITGPDTTHICYCHSPMRYAWDWHAEFAAERGLHSTPMKTFLYEQSLSKIRLWDAVSAKRVDVWIANAKTVEARIKKYYRADSQVIFPPVDTEYFDPAKLEKIEKGSHAFAISRLTTSKRIDQIIRACHVAGIPLRLAGAGDDSWCRAIAEELKADVTFLGEISEEAKRQELAEAGCFVFAAEDDFGIAPVEALAMGTPVVALGKGGATETVIPGKNGWLYPEATVESLTQALHTFKKEGAPAAPEEIRKTALRFSSETFEAAIKKAIETHGQG